MKAFLNKSYPYAPMWPQVHQGIDLKSCVSVALLLTKPSGRSLTTLTLSFDTALTTISAGAYAGVVSVFRV